ncbi:MAG: hypothetical protein JWQ40_5077 [Segetibacter sp.]|nr:hypothetical protein [Segetibacter sp.]
MKAFLFSFIAILLLKHATGQNSEANFNFEEAGAKKITTSKNVSLLILSDSINISADRIYSLIREHKKIKGDTVVIFIRSTNNGFIEWNRLVNIPGSSSAKKDGHSNSSIISPSTKKPLLKVHGNVLYDLNYNSRIDTPYAEKEIYQHTVQTYLDITVKDQYPLRFYFTTRFSNSSLFRNFTDLNLQFDPLQFRNKIKENLKSRIKPPFQLDSLERIKSLLEKKAKELYDLRNWLKDPATIQRLIEEREKQLYGQKSRVENGEPGLSQQSLTGIVDKEAKTVSIQRLRKEASQNKDLDNRKDSINSSINNFQQKYDENKRKVDSAESELVKLRQLYNQGTDKLKNSPAFSRSEIDAIKDVRILKNKLAKEGLSDTLLPKGYKLLWGLRSFKIGRSLVDYSELSAKNISIKGLQVEYNPYYYYAFATGFIDYRFRDFIVRNKNTSLQYLNLIRVGKGLKEGNNLIVTHYSGSRQLYNSSSTLQGFQIPNYKLMGYTIEGQIKVNKTTFITGEAAKSSVPYYSLSSGDKNLFSSAFKMRDHSNEAYSIKVVSFIPSTRTKLNGYYRRFGANFQSFSLFTSGSAQSSWAFRVEQPFLKRRLIVNSSIRANDFTNPFIGRQYKSTTIFKSIQATLRIKRLPILSLGYSPSSQLTKLNDGQFVENLFHTLTASANHFYRHKAVMYNTSVIYMQFYNKETDSNFVYFNTKNLFLSQSIILDKLSVQFNFSGSSNTDYKLYTYEHNLQYKLNEWFRIGGGVKYNRQTIYDRELWGYAGNALLKIPKVGELQVTMDKGFIPGSNKELVDNTIGRLTFFKVF